MKSGINSSKMGNFNAETNGWKKTGNIYPRRSVKGGTNTSEIGSIMPTTTAENRAAFTLVIVPKAALTAVKLAV